MTADMTPEKAQRWADELVNGTSHWDAVENDFIPVPTIVNSLAQAYTDAAAREQRTFDLLVDLQRRVTSTLNQYVESDDPEQCMPEDRWRLYRDLREDVRQSRLTLDGDA